MMSFDHKKFVQRVREITSCDHERAFEVLGIVLEHTQAAFVQGVSAVHNGTSSVKPVQASDGLSDIEREGLAWNAPAAVAWNRASVRERGRFLAGICESLARAESRWEALPLHTQIAWSKRQIQAALVSKLTVARSRRREVPATEAKEVADEEAWNRATVDERCRFAGSIPTSTAWARAAWQVLPRPMKDLWSKLRSAGLEDAHTPPGNEPMPTLPSAEAAEARGVASDDEAAWNNTAKEWRQQFLTSIYASTTWSRASWRHLPRDIRSAWARRKEPSDSQPAADPTNPLHGLIARVESAHFRSQHDTGATAHALFIWNLVRAAAGLEELRICDLPTWDGVKYTTPANSRLLRSAL